MSSPAVCKNNRGRWRDGAGQGGPAAVTGPAAGHTVRVSRSASVAKLSAAVCRSRHRQVTAAASAHGSACAGSASVLSPRLAGAPLRVFSLTHPPRQSARTVVRASSRPAPPCPARPALSSSSVVRRPSSVRPLCPAVGRARTLL